MYELLIKNGRVVDGSGLPAYTADVAIQDGRIAAIGRIDRPARRTLDAAGRVVSPGFIDPHTHFDAQLLWDGYAKPALSHGVTTIVPGNCSLSLAPLKAPQYRMKLVGMFNQIEEMPLQSLREGRGVELGNLLRVPARASARASPSTSRRWSATACCACG
jgi:N-acyl-D-amino-acid deacylase